MTERPILFNAPMVRALLEGRKTQTRRVVKEWNPGNDLTKAVPADLQYLPDFTSYRATCPYGVPGDRLWVREAWRTAESLDKRSPLAMAEMCLDAGYPRPWAPLHYEADGHRNSEWRGFETPPKVSQPGKLRPSTHMPRWASRILLEVTAVRVERLQEISEHDARAEGASYHDGRGIGHSGWRHDYGDVHADARSAYARLWNELNGPGSWDANPWVWVVEFRRDA